MSYLARLKRLDDAKIFTHTPEIVLPKLTEPGCVSCVSSIPAHIEKINAANDGEKVVTENNNVLASTRLREITEHLHDTNTSIKNNPINGKTNKGMTFSSCFCPVNFLYQL